MLVHTTTCSGHAVNGSLGPPAETRERQGLRDNLPWNISQQARSDWHCEMAIENKCLDSLTLHLKCRVCPAIPWQTDSRSKYATEYRSRKDASAGRVTLRRGAECGGYFSSSQPNRVVPFCRHCFFVPPTPAWPIQAVALPLALATWSRPALMRARMSSRSLSSLSLVMTTLLGWMPRGTLWPVALSRVTRSTWITYLRR